MASVVAEFFQITGVATAPLPTIPLAVLLPLTPPKLAQLVTAVFRIVAAVAAALVNWRRF